jgi:aminodeoxychorismate synthase component I
VVNDCYLPFVIFQAKDDVIWLKTKTGQKQCSGRSFLYLKQLFLELAAALPQEKKFPLDRLGLVGYFSYDLNRQFEKLPNWQVDDLALPDILFLAYQRYFLFDHQKRQCWFVALVPHDAFINLEIELEKVLAAKPVKLELAAEKLNWRSNLSKEQFVAMVKKAKEYIFAGDIYQVNLSQRLQTTTSSSPLAIYAHLRQINPSPFAGYFNFNSWHLVSCSPERLLRLEGKTVETRPIAGTVRRGLNQAEDSLLKKELTVNIKERAEHLMLVDLERNDLGRVCNYGTVKVNELMITESYSHVTHIVSNIVGQLNKKKDQFNLIKACFPGGTITGCPKIRAMEIIEELEPVRRGPYTGSMGYLSFSGNLDLNIIIRTLVMVGKQAYIQAGAGIVADSEPEKEYYETLYKAEAFTSGLALQF